MGCEHETSESLDFDGAKGELDCDLRDERPRHLPDNGASWELDCDLRSEDRPNCPSSTGYLDED